MERFKALIKGCLFYYINIKYYVKILDIYILLCYYIDKLKESKTLGTNKMMKFKKDKQVTDLWVAERIVDKLFISDNEYVIEKDLETNEYCLYINGAKYSVFKTLKTAKKDANEHFSKSPKKVFA